MEAVRGYIGIGLYFVVLAFYWLVQAAYTLENRRRDGGKFRRWKFGCKNDRMAISPPCSPPDQSSLVPLDGCPATLWCVRLQRWPVESVFRCAISFIAVVSEITVSLMHDGLYEPCDVQRITIYSILCLSGFVDFLQHFGLMYPAGTGHFLVTLAFTAEAFFYDDFYYQDLDDPYRYYKRLAVYSALLCAATSAIKMFHLQQLGIRLLRSFFVLLHGTWLLHVGTLIVEDGASQNVSWVNVFFVWHVVGVFVFSSLLAAIVFWVKGHCRQGSFPPALPCWCSCASVDDLNDGFRHTPSDDLDETEPLALHP